MAEFFAGRVLAEKLARAVDILGRVMDQTERRVFKKEDVPASEKVVSFFETHTDIIVKKRGLSVFDMAKSAWVYKKISSFRAGIEARFSPLKRTFGLDRCTWKGWEGIGQYVLSAVVSCNLLVVIRTKMTSA